MITALLALVYCARVDDEPVWLGIWCSTCDRLAHPLHPSHSLDPTNALTSTGRIFTIRIRRMGEGNSLSVHTLGVLGYPPPSARTGLGYPPARTGLGYPPARSGWGTPPPGQVRTGVPPLARSGWSTFPAPRQNSRASTCYAAGGMPLAFTQEDSLVSDCVRCVSLPWS